jgi:hypothetical protein
MIGASAEHSPAHHLMNGCCCGDCGEPTAGGAPTSQVTSAGGAAACGFTALAVWSLPYGRPPRETLAA